jgi:hypothetical protein
MHIQLIRFVAILYDPLLIHLDKQIYQYICILLDSNSPSTVILIAYKGYTRIYGVNPWRHGQQDMPFLKKEKEKKKIVSVTWTTPESTTIYIVRSDFASLNDLERHMKTLHMLL